MALPHISALAAIGIKNAHGEIERLGGKEQDQAIAADAEVPVADTAGEQMGWGTDWLRQSMKM
ncbi:MAG: hypothetical protein ACLTY5_06740 [Angelakisella sp.]